MKNIFPVYVRVPLIFFIVFGAMEYAIDSGSQPAFIKYPMVGVFLLVFIFLLIAFEITISAIDRITYTLLTEEQKLNLELESNTPITEKAWYKKLMRRLTKAEPMENEANLLMHHDYDGIKELDNDLPPWWTYLFIASVIFGFVYMIQYEILGADNQEDELRKELAQAKIEVAEYMKTAPDLMDENSVVLLTGKTDIATGKEIFTTNCAACHRVDAGGQIGPNLTDTHWILGGGIKNIFHTISNGGRDGKGMIAWKSTLKPKEIQMVSSYIISLQGSNPAAPKEPEGDVWVDDNAPKSDTTTTIVTDSTVVK